jgi:hypothetical protein
VGAANRLRACFRETEVCDLAFADQIFDRARDVLDRYVGVDPVLIEEIDPIGLEPLQRRLGDFANVRRAAVEPRLLPAVEFESELGGDDDLIANRRERVTHEFFVREWPVRFGGGCP